MLNLNKMGQLVFKTTKLCKFKKKVYSLIGDQCYKYKIQNLIIFEINFGKYRYYFEYCKVAKFIGQ